MSLNTVSLSFGYYPDPTVGRPVFNGSIFIGEPDLDPTILANQKTITIRQEGVDTPSVPQPISTSAGGVPVFNGSPAEILVDGEFSMAVLNSGGTQVYYVASQGGAETFTGTDKRYGPIFATIAAMTAADPVSIDGVVVIIEEGVLYRTEGYTAAGDNGQGVYLGVAPVSVDGKGNHLAANGISLILQSNGEMNVRQFDGDNAAFETAFDLVDENIYGQELFGVIRNSGTGWAFIDDVSHKPGGFQGIVETTSDVRLLYKTNSAKVGTLFAAQDETFAKLGLSAGASVATGQGNFSLYKEANILYNTAGRSFTGDSIDLAHFSANYNAVAFTHEITHGASVNNGLIATVLSGEPYDIRISHGSDTIFFIFQQQNMSTFSFFSTTWQSSNSMIDDSGITYNFAAGVLTVTHPAVAERMNLNIIAFDSIYTIKLVATQTTNFGIQFFDSGGSQIMAEDANMKFLWTREHEVDSEIDSGRFIKITGKYLVDPTLVNEAGGNFWIYGTMWRD